MGGDVDTRGGRKGVDVPMVFFQSAVLYTTTTGQRRVHVSTIMRRIEEGKYWMEGSWIHLLKLNLNRRSTKEPCHHSFLKQITRSWISSINVPPLLSPHSEKPDFEPPTHLFLIRLLLMRWALDGICHDIGLPHTGLCKNEISSLKSSVNNGTNLHYLNNIIQT